MPPSKYDKAKPLMLQGLAISEKVYGKEHPNYALKLNNLAQLYQAQVRNGSLCC